MPNVMMAVGDSVYRTFTADNLLADGYEVRVADDPREALRRMAAQAFEILIVDARADLQPVAIAVLDTLRISTAPSPLPTDVPVIAVVADDPLARVRALERGADDVVTERTTYPELRARVTALLRRAGDRLPRVIEVGTLRIDLEARRCWREGQGAIMLTSRDWALLRPLAVEPDKIHTRPELTRALWGPAAEELTTRALDTGISKLRRKLSTPNEQLVCNVHGVGWSLRDTRR